jgi:hypothetical protein
MDKTRFVNEVVLGWMKSDLARMRDSIRPVSSEIGNINFPLALCVLSYMEYLGGFLLGKDVSYTTNVNEYITACFSNAEEYPSQILNDLIRNGLAHDYFPRGAISRNGKHPAIYKGRTYELVLDAETLVNDFINSLPVFISKLDDARYEARMKTAMSRIEMLKQRHKDYIDDLPCQPDDNDQATPSSGPSGYPGQIMNTTTLDPSIK